MMTQVTSKTTPTASPNMSQRLDGGTTAGRQGRLVATWPWIGCALLAVVAGFGVLFFKEASAAIRTWNGSETFTHCWLVLPIAAWLAWTRRHRLQAMPPRPSPLLALLALPMGLGWLAAERLGIMEGRQLAALGLLQVAILSLIGWRSFRAMAAPLAYLIFLVPFGAFVTPALQTVTSWIIELGLQVFGVPHYIDEYIIETPAGTFLVAEACAGLRFLIAAIAFGALYALVMFRTPGRRFAVMVLAVVVPIVANGLRALGIVLLGQYLGSAEAAAVDHVIYGGVFFVFVLMLLILAGLPFRQDSAHSSPAQSAPDTLPAPSFPAPSLAVAVVAAVLSLGMAAAGPLAAGVLGQAGEARPGPQPLRLAAFAGCELDQDDTVLRCPGSTLTASLAVFHSGVTWNVVTAEQNRLTSTSDLDRQFTVAVPGSASWRVRQTGEPATTVAITSWLGGNSGGNGLRRRVDQAWNSVVGGRGTPVLGIVTIRTTEGTTGSGPGHRRLLEAVLGDQGGAFAAEAASRSRQ